jgi:hypothetical protein
MRVFISWSGPQAKAVAEGLKEWLPQVLARKVSCFVSSTDIDTGQRGLNVIAQQLEQCEFGIVVVTPENQEKPWINFEAGALSKAFEDHAQVTPLLVGLAEQDVKQPLAQFQMCTATSRESVLQMVLSVNRVQSDPLDEAAASSLFDVHWNSFESLLAAAMTMTTIEKPRRTAEELLEEVLTTVRGLQRQVDDLREPAVRASPLSRTEQKVTEAATRALEYVTLMSPQNTEVLSAERLGQSIILPLPDSVASPGPEFIEAFERLAATSQLTFRLQWGEGPWFQFEPDGRHKSGLTGPVAPES